MQKIQDYLTLNGWKADFRETVSDLQRTVTYVKDFARSQHQKYFQDSEGTESLLTGLEKLREGLG